MAKKEHKVMTTTEISKEIGMNVSVNLLSGLGFDPEYKTTTGSYWRQADVPIMCMKLSAHFSHEGIKFINKHYVRGD